MSDWLKRLMQTRLARGRGRALDTISADYSGPEALSDDELKAAADASTQAVYVERDELLATYSNADRVCSYSQQTHDMFLALHVLGRMEMNERYLQLLSVCEELAERLVTMESRSPAAKLYAGVWKQGQAAEAGRLYTHGGSVWHCDKDTTGAPGEDLQAWTLAVKRGRDGKDARP